MSTCGHCGAIFSCGMQDASTGTPCWCTQLPPLALDRMPARADAGTSNCLCPSCLRAWIDAATKPQE